MRRALVALCAVAWLAFTATAVAAPVHIRHVEWESFPLVRVTALVPSGSRPVLYENGRGASFRTQRVLGSAGALILAVDNSASMRGRPLREAKAAARQFLAGEQRAASTGLVAFGHEALVLTAPNQARGDVVQTLLQLAPDAHAGTSLYDAVVASARRLQRMPAATRILVVLTDGRDVGSNASLNTAVRAAQRANVVVYAIAAGRRAEKQTLSVLATETGGRLFDATDVSQLGAIYDALGRELDRTWQISYLSNARPGDAVKLALLAGPARTTMQTTVPGSTMKASGPLPRAIARSSTAAVAIVLIVAALLTAAIVGMLRGRRRSGIARLLEPHVGRQAERQTGGDGEGGRMEALTIWTEHALADLPALARLTRSVERSGIKIRIGHVPYVALLSAFVLGIVGAVIGAGPVPALFLMLIGLAAPFVVFRIAGARRRKAFDRQLPDVLATVASTLRAGHGLRVALRAVADDGSPPASEEFTRVLGEERLGRPLPEAMGAMCERVGSSDLDYVATAIDVQSQAGGSLASLFDTLSETVRERQRHARKVRALTSMGRMSAIILVTLPFGLAALMTLISPTYMAPFYETSTGKFLIGFCLVSMALGGLLLKRIVNVRY